MKKFIFDKSQSNLGKFINIYQGYMRRTLNANELFNFNRNFKNLGKEKNLEILILDYKFISEFMDLGENNFIYYY